MQTRVFVSALLLAGCCLLSRPAHADDGDVAVGGVMLFRIHATVNGMSPKERADIVDTRLQDILAAPVIKPEDVRIVGADKNSAKIMVKERLLVTVTKADGAANGVTTQKQAQMWLESLRKTLPKVNAKPNPNNEPK
jgi:hypothetical protein